MCESYLYDMRRLLTRKVASFVYEMHHYKSIHRLASDRGHRVVLKLLEPVREHRPCRLIVCATHVPVSSSNPGSQ